MKIAKTYFFISFIILLVVSCSKDEDDETSIDQENTVLVDDVLVTDEILKLVNQHRQSIGLTSLTKNETATELAIDHTKYMISKKEISHDDFNQRADVLRDQENANDMAENVASFYPDAESVVMGWLNSPGHKKNIEGNYTYIGISAIKDKDGNYYYTQLFYH